MTYATNSLWKLNFLKERDERIIPRFLLFSFKKTGKVITVEDNTVCGGLGTIVEDVLGTKVTKLGYKDKIITHGDLKTLYKENGVDAQSIADEIERMCNI